MIIDVCVHEAKRTKASQSTRSERQAITFRFQLEMMKQKVRRLNSVPVVSDSNRSENDWECVPPVLYPCPSDHAIV